MALAPEVTLSLRGQRRAAGKFAQRSVSNVLQIRDADFAGVKSVAGHIAQQRKKCHALAQRRIFDSVLAISDQLHDFFLLLRRTFEKRLAVTVAGETVQPEQAAAEPQLEFFVLTGE